MEYCETIIVGGGQAGLAVSYYLKNANHEHLILEKAARPAHVWTAARWDSFTLVIPNRTIMMPGTGYQGEDPDGFLPRDEIGAYFQGYVHEHAIPIRYEINVISVEQLADRNRYLITTDRGNFTAANVVIATGLYQRPRLPIFSSKLPVNILQLHSGEYRNPQVLPPGSVLVVGSGQSGCQIAEELYLSGRKVYLSVGSAGRAPRRYRGRDIIEWLLLVGFFDRTADKLPSPRARFSGNPHLSGISGGHSLNLHQFSRDGVTLLGRVIDVYQESLNLIPNLNENLAKVDKVETDMTRMIDEYIKNNSLDAPEEQLPQLKDGYAVDELQLVDLNREKINTIIWAAGYAFDFNLVHLPVTDGDGYPLQERGITRYPGLYFIGLPWLYKFKSGLLLGVGEDAKFLAAHLLARKD